VGDVKPRISIVTISCNQAAFLERAIRSVVEQDYPDVEYIVVDPGSTDGSREIIEKYRSRISKVIFEKDSGPANGLNKGFAAATGEIFGYINADDAYLPGALTKAAAALEARPRADVVYGHCYIVDREGQLVRRSRSVPFNLRLYAYGAVVVMQQSTFFRRKAFEKVGGFKESNRTSWDGELLMDMALQGSQLAMVDEYWSLYAIYQGSITATLKYNQQYGADRARMFRIITGRDMARTNKIFFLMARVEKLLRNPLVPLHRIIDKTPARSRLPTVGVTAFS
jgi:glycosyltransferase involved in cell wall biosynthesis